MTFSRSTICASAALLLVASSPAHAAAPPPLTVDLGEGATLSLVLIPKGSFTQGSPPTEKNRAPDETPHQVTLREDFYLGQYPVTVAQFTRFAAATGYRTEAEKGSSGGSGFDGKALVQRKEFTWRNPGFSQAGDHPVTLVTYDDARAFTAWLTRLTGRSFDLPTEAQWEYAYRAGSAGPYYGADSEQGALSLGWFKENAPGGTHPVGQKTPNAFGLFDMAGNVNAWCRDWYAPYPQGAAVDPEATAPDASDKARRVLRGGSWFREARHGRAAARYRNTPGSRNADNGFRVMASAAAPAVTPPLPLQQPSPAGTPKPPPMPEREPSTKDTGILALLGSGCVGTLALGALLVGWAIKRGSKGRGPGTSAAPQVSFRLGADGFWVQAPAHLRGATLRYRFRLPGTTTAQFQQGSVVIEPNPAGQFVYTGYQPLGVEALAVATVQQQAAPARPFRSSWSSRGVHQPVYDHAAQTPARRSDPPPFRGYPSAY